LPAVHHKEPALGVADQLELVKDRLGRGFLLDLLRHKPLQHLVGGVVLQLDAEIDQLVDQAGDVALVFERFLEYVDRRLPVGRRCLDRQQLDPPAAFGHVLVEPHRMGQFFLVLHAHPLREAGQALRLEVSGHRQIQVGRVDLGVDLLVNRFLHFRVNHLVFPP
jgi:hypothetical protein